MTRILIPLPGRRHIGRRTRHFAFTIATLLLASLAPGARAQGTAPIQCAKAYRAGHPQRKRADAADCCRIRGASRYRSIAFGAGRGHQCDCGRRTNGADRRGAKQSDRGCSGPYLCGRRPQPGDALHGDGAERCGEQGEAKIAALLLAAGARSTGKSVGDTVCVRPWGGDGFCGTVKSFSIPSVQIQVTKIVGCENGCPAKPECSASKPVGGADGLQEGNQIAVPSWCLTQTGVKP